MRQSYFTLARVLCAAGAALAASACGGQEGAYSNPAPDIERSDTGALLEDAVDSPPSGAGSPGDEGSPGGSASGTCQLPDGPRSFDELKGPPGSLAADCVPTWTEEQLSSGFAAIRDSRLLTVPEQPEFLRRIPWLAADNGCEERAEAAVYFFHQWDYPTPYFARVKAKPRKRLVLQTANEPSGTVTWSGHVAPVVWVGGQLMILDAAIDPSRPLPIAEWLSRFSVADDIDVALCRDHALGEGCFDAVPVEPPPPDLNHGGSMYTRLLTEWRVQEILGRDPYRVLGDCPLWGTCAEPEPTPDPDLPPTIRRFASDQFDSPVWYPIYVIGDNFVEGWTTVRITGNGIDELAPIDACNIRRILINQEYPPGDYQVTVSNGELASQPMVLRIQ